MSFSNPFKNVTEPVLPEKAVKALTHRAESLRRAVAGLPCSLCSYPAPSQAGHANQGKGMGIKTSDATLFSICPTCHAEIDQGGMPKEERRALEERLNLWTLRTLVERGILHL